MNIFEIILAIAVFILLVNYISTTRRRMMFMYKMHEAMEEAQDHIKLCFIEKHGDVLYLWSKDGNVFITQGKTLEEIQANCLAYFPKEKFIVEDSQNLLVSKPLQTT
jgi:hypothetical protein